MTSPTTPGGANYSTTDASSPVPMGVPVTSFNHYASAQRAVDFLSDNKFPVQHSAIIGQDLRLVEKVTGRLTTAKAALAGAATGAWLGLLIGLLFGLWSDRPLGWVLTVLVSVLIFAFWGAVFGAIAHAMTGGQRDFASRSTIVAGRYDLLVEPSHVEQATQLLSRLTDARRQAP